MYGSKAKRETTLSPTQACNQPLVWVLGVWWKTHTQPGRRSRGGRHKQGEEDTSGGVRCMQEGQKKPCHMRAPPAASSCSRGEGGSDTCLWYSFAAGLNSTWLTFLRCRRACCQEPCAGGPALPWLCACVRHCNRLTVAPHGIPKCALAGDLALGLGGSYIPPAARGRAPGVTPWAGSCAREARLGRACSLRPWKGPRMPRRRCSYSMAAWLKRHVCECKHAFFACDPASVRVCQRDPVTLP